MTDDLTSDFAILPSPDAILSLINDDALAAAEVLQAELLSQVAVNRGMATAAFAAVGVLLPIDIIGAVVSFAVAQGSPLSAPEED